MDDSKTLYRTYTNRALTASGSDELIVELMKSLIGITDQNVIRRVSVRVEYQKPFVKEERTNVTASDHD